MLTAHRTLQEHCCLFEQAVVSSASKEWRGALKDLPQPTAIANAVPGFMTPLCPLSPVIFGRYAFLQQPAVRTFLAWHQLISTVSVLSDCLTHVCNPLHNNKNTSRIKPSSLRLVTTLTASNSESLLLPSGGGQEQTDVCYPGH